MKTLIVYVTKRGTTEKCANLLAKKMRGSVELYNLKIKKAQFPNLESYNTVIIGSPIYMGKIDDEISDFCKQYLETLKGKKIGLFICGMREGKESQTEFNTFFPEELLKIAITMGCFGGELIFSKMNFIERFIIKKLAKVDKDISNILEENIEKFALSLNNAN